MAGRAPARLRARLALGVARQAHCGLWEWLGGRFNSSIFKKRMRASYAYRALLVLFMINFYSSFSHTRLAFRVLATNTTSCQVSRDRALLVVLIIGG